ncbi:hypothetical protein FRB98_007875 [Tulasnella sp. 332]|nr:hypothetical protein FRB98_007875 [Tulasnella sp. 332]
MPTTYERGETRKVVAYGRRARNFIKAKDLTLTISPRAKLATVPQNVIDPPHPSLDKWLGPKPTVQKSRVSSISRRNKENVVAPSKAPTLKQVTQARNPIVVASPPRRLPSKPRNTLRQTVLPNVIKGPTRPLTSMLAPTVQQKQLVDAPNDEETAESVESDPVFTHRLSPRSSLNTTSDDDDDTFRQDARRAKIALANKTGTKMNPMVIISDDETEDEEVFVPSPRKRGIVPSRSKPVIVSSDEEEIAAPSDRKGTNTAARAIPTPKKYLVARILKGPVDLPETRLHVVLPVQLHAAMGSCRSARQLLSQKVILGFGKQRKSQPASVEVISRDHLGTGDGPSQRVHTANRNIEVENQAKRTRKERVTENEPLARVQNTLTKTGMVERATEAVEKLSIKTSSSGVKMKATAQQTSRSGDLDPPVPPPSPKHTGDVSKPPVVDSQVPKGLCNLLKCCDQPAVLEFESFVATYPFDEVHGADAGTAKFRKIGEASYSEVFAVGDVVLKIVPLLVDGQASSGSEDELPSVSPAADVEKEILVTKLVGRAHSGFIKLLNAYVVRGPYPPELLELWDQYTQNKESENIRPRGCSPILVNARTSDFLGTDVLPPSTHYAIIVLPNGGVDLEAYTFPLCNAWKSAVSVLWQVTRALAVAEDRYQFEHRDLHWGQILVQDEPKNVGGVVAKIIDFGLSRLENDDGVTYHTAFEPEIFDGKGKCDLLNRNAFELHSTHALGDYQFDIYRLMKERCENEWETFRPLSNVMWLHYLSVKLLKSKGLRRPTAAKTSSTRGIQTHTAAQVEREEERAWYDSLVEVESYLSKAVKAASKRGGKRKTTGEPLPESAIDVMTWMRDRAQN